MTTIDRTPQRIGVGAWHTSSHGRRLETTGLAHLPRTGGAVLALTHFAHRELTLVELAVWRHSRRRIRSLVRNGRVDEPAAGSLLRPLRRIPGDLQAGAAAYAGAPRTLRNGELVAMFPEARGAGASGVGELRVGAARVAVEADVPLLPVVVWSNSFRPPGPRRHFLDDFGVSAPVRVAFGEPIPMQRSEDVRAVTDELRATMQRMLLRLVLPG